MAARHACSATATSPARAASVSRPTAPQIVEEVAARAARRHDGDARRRLRLAHRARRPRARAWPVRGAAQPAARWRWRRCSCRGCRATASSCRASTWKLSRERRLDLLRGLLDTDGWVETLGQRALSRRPAGNSPTTSPSSSARSAAGARSPPSGQAAANVAGLRVDGLPAYVCHISHPEPRSLFLLSEKQARAPAARRRCKRLDDLVDRAVARRRVPLHLGQPSGAALRHRRRRGDAQHRLRAQHRRAGGRQRGPAGGGVLDGDGRGAARPAHGRLARPHRPAAPAHRRAARRRVGPALRGGRQARQGEPLHRREPGAHAERAARPRAPAGAAVRQARPDRRRLHAAHERLGLGRRGEPRHRARRDLARPEIARQGAAVPGDRAVAAQPQRRVAHRQAADDERPARMRHRRHAGLAGRRAARADRRAGRADAAGARGRLGPQAGAGAVGLRLAGRHQAGAAAEPGQRPQPARDGAAPHPLRRRLAHAGRHAPGRPGGAGAQGAAAGDEPGVARARADPARAPDRRRQLPARPAAALHHRQRGQQRGRRRGGAGTRLDGHAACRPGRVAPARHRRQRPPLEARRRRRLAQAPRAVRPALAREAPAGRAVRPRRRCHRALPAPPVGDRRLHPCAPGRAARQPPRLLRDLQRAAGARRGGAAAAPGHRRAPAPRDRRTRTGRCGTSMSAAPGSSSASWPWSAPSGRAWRPRGRCASGWRTSKPTPTSTRCRRRRSTRCGA